MRLYSAAQIQAMIRKNTETDQRPVYKLLSHERAGNCANQEDLDKWLKACGKQSKNSSHRSWEKRLGSKQWKQTPKKSNKAEPITKSIYNRNTKQFEQVPLNARQKEWR